MLKNGLERNKRIFGHPWLNFLEAVKNRHGVPRNSGPFEGPDEYAQVSVYFFYFWGIYITGIQRKDPGCGGVNLNFFGEGFQRKF